MEEKIINSITDFFYNWATRKGFDVSYNSINLLLIVACLPFFWRLIAKLYKTLLLFRAKHDLSPFIDSFEVRNATRYYISTKGQNITPTNEQEPRNSQAFIAKESIIPFYIKAITNPTNGIKYFLILADSGMGKSTFLINFYLAYTRLIIPRRFRMILIPLANPHVDEYIGSIENPEKTILLLDGFDEDPKASLNYEDRLNSLLQKTWRFKNVFLTCRTQFFPSEANEPHRTSVYKHSLNDETQHHFKKIYISPFDDRDVSKYLEKKYPIWKVWLLRKRLKARRIIKLVPNLMVRPMLLSYIDSLVSAKGIRIFTRRTGKLTMSDVYGLLINRWIEREANRIDISRRADFKNNMFNFSLHLAAYMYNKGQLKVDLKEILEIAKNNQIDLTLLELKGKSLLNRDGAGNYKFSHKSILEYLLARYAMQNSTFGDAVSNFSGMRDYEQASKFCTELMINELRQ